MTVRGLGHTAGAPSVYYSLAGIAGEEEPWEANPEMGSVRDNG